MRLSISKLHDLLHLPILIYKEEVYDEHFSAGLRMWWRRKLRGILGTRDVHWALGVHSHYLRQLWKTVVNRVIVTANFALMPTLRTYKQVKESADAKYAITDCTVVGEKISFARTEKRVVWGVWWTTQCVSQWLCKHKSTMQFGFAYDENGKKCCKKNKGSSKRYAPRHQKSESYT